MKEIGKMERSNKLLFTKKDIAVILIPLILQSILSVTIGMVDSLMVSNKGEDAFAGVSLVNSLDTVLITLFSALTTGGSVVLAQAMGRGDRDKACDAAKQLIYAASFVAAVITTLVLIFRYPLLNLLFGDAEASVMKNAHEYFFFIALSFPFLAMENSVTATFRAQGDSMIALKISMFMNIFNIVGNYLLIYVADLGAMGAAIATLVSRIIGSSIMIIIAHNNVRYIFYNKIFKYKPDWSIIKSILNIGVPNGIENSMFQFGRLMTSSLVSSLGTVAIVANAAALNLANFQYNAGAAVQSTTVTVIGRCVGANDKEQAKYFARYLLSIAYAIVFAVDLIMCIFATPLLTLYDLSGASLNLARILLIYHSIASMILWPAAFCLPPSFRAASDVKFTMYVSIFSMWVFRVALGYVLALETVEILVINGVAVFTVPGFALGVIGVWIAMTVDWIFRTILFVWRYLSGKWLTKYKPKV